MILKLGSKGPEVKKLQEFLGISADGDFGPKTEAAVKSWQSVNGLVADGIVGPKTMEAMGLATTDIFENSDHDVEFDEIISYLPKGEYKSGNYKKRWMFLHHTAGWHNPFKTVTNWANDSRGPVATEFIIGGQSIKGNETKYDGTLVKCMPDGAFGWHLGTGNDAMHRESVGVEVNCFGQLTKGGYKKDKQWITLDKNSYYTYVGVKADPSQVVTLKKKFRGYEYWHRYSDKQIATLKELIKDVVDRDSIDIEVGLIPMIKTKGAFEAFDFCNVDHVRKNPGLWSHTSVLSGKVDMFPQDELIDMLLSL
jgi:hypothetical protein